MRTLILTAYQFNELSPEAKKKAIADNEDINTGHDWWEFTYDDAEEVGVKITGFDIGRGREIEGRLILSAEYVAALIKKNHGPDCETRKVAMQFKKDIHVAKVTCRLLGRDEDDDDNIKDICARFENDILDAYLNMLEREYEYQQTEEAIIEAITGNEYEFDEDGNRI